MFLWGNLPQLIPNKLILSVAYILGYSEAGGPSPTPAPCAALDHLAEVPPMGSFCAGRRPVLCHRLGSGLQQLHPSRCLPGWAQPGLKAGGWALPPNTHSKQSPAVGGRAAQQLLHREQHTDGYPLGSICPEPLGPPARQSSRPGLPPGPRGRELCLCRGWAAWPAPARLAGCPLRPAACAAPRGARPEVKVSVRRPHTPSPPWPTHSTCPHHNHWFLAFSDFF